MRDKLSYGSWRAMKRRCLELTNDNYKYYGGRGIKVCPQWIESFPQFIHDMGKRPSAEYTLERLDNNGDYVPENVVWALALDQNRNKSTTKYLTMEGETRTVGEWSSITGISQHRIYCRLRSGWTINDVLSVPIIRGRTSVSRGNCRANRNLTYKGEIRSITEWAKICKMPMKTLHNRIRLGWSTERALTKPLRLGIRNIVKAIH